MSLEVSQPMKSPMDQGQGFRSELKIDGRVYHLPPRRAGRLFVIILLLIGGTLVTVGVLHLLALPFVLFGLTAIALAATVYGGHNSIQITRDHVLSVDHLGPLHWTRRRYRADIRRLEVNTMTSSTNGGPAKPVESFALLAGMVEADPSLTRKQNLRRSLIMAWGYPRKLLIDVANELSHELALSGGSRLIDDADALPVTESAGSFDEQEQTVDRPVSRPADAVTLLDRNDAGLTLTVPPLGVWKGSKGLFFFSLLWNGFMAVFTPLMLMGLFKGEVESDLPEWAVVPALIAFLALFWAIGIGMFLAAFNAGKRRAILDVVGDTLVVTRQSIFGTRQMEWRAEDIEDIRMGPSGMEVNDVPVMQLQIHPKVGRKKGMLTQLPNEELTWIAWELRTAMGISKTN
ncbi:MAG: hypothetical protein IT445_12550 [Phycisphaeraceae bacterium]|nr:hypothetical protein [Phycisphaeraceae bacterium]